MSILTDLTVIDIKGKKFSVRIAADTGQFYATDDGEEFKASTLDGLKTILRNKMARSKIKINIPFCRWEDDSVKVGVIVGIHGANRNLLIKWKGESGIRQDRHWGSEDFIKPHAETDLRRPGEAFVKARK